MKKLVSMMLSVIMVISLLPLSTLTVSAKTNIDIGDYIQMGTYYGEPILWRCVDIDENGPLMLSDKIICFKAYDAAGTNTSGSHGRGKFDDKGIPYRTRRGSNYWGDSNIRCWLNSNANAGEVVWTCGNPPIASAVDHNPYADEAGFLTNFTQKENELIKTVKQKTLLDAYEYSQTPVSNYHKYNSSQSITSILQNYDTAYCEYTTDKMFLIDVKQLYTIYLNRNILGDNYYTGEPTDEAMANNTRKGLPGYYSILRSPSVSPSTYSAYGAFNYKFWGSIRYAYINKEKTYISIGSFEPKSSSGAIRPAFYLADNANFIFGDGSEDNPYRIVDDIPVSSVLITASRTQMKVNETLQLQAQCFPANATNKAVTWSSSNPSVVKVNNNGVVTAKGPGKATITAKSNNGKTASCGISVIEQNVIDYDDFRYKFDNSYDSFGYALWYKIPKERYFQAGIPESKINKEYDFWGGSCYGMSTSSILFYKNKLKEERYNENVHIPYDFEEPDSWFLNKEQIKLKEMIELFQVSQFLDKKGWMVEDDSFAPAIAEQLNQGNPGVLGMYNNDGGHAVVIYGYSKSGDTYTFYIYDCSNFVTKLVYTNKDNWHFDNDKYGWRPEWFQTYQSLENNYLEIYSNNHNNAASLFSVEEEKNIYITRVAGDFVIINSVGEISEVKNGKLSGEIKNIRLVPSGYLAQTKAYKIIAPTDTYTIVGSGDEVITTSFADDYMSSSVTAKSNTPITISSDLKEISVDTLAGEEYDITYTTYDNIFDEMNLSGTATGTVTTKLNDADISISGVNTLTASASVSDSVVSTNSDSLSSNDEITVKCEEADSGATIQILSADAELTEKTDLPERLTVSAPTYDLVSGTYTEGQVLNFTKDDETIIYYTTDGSIPSADNGIIYSLPIEINKSMTIKAISTKYGYLDSEIVELNYTLPEVDKPEANIESGEYDEVITVELSTGDYEDTIYYTLDGSNPLENGILYTVPINISEDTYLQAYTLRNGCISEISEYEYTVAPTYPFYFSNSLTNQDGEIITPDNIADVTKVKMTLSKLHTGDHTGMFLIAFYDADNRLIYANYKSATISEDIDEVEIDITEDVSSAYKVKVFAWKDLSSVQPICEALEENIIIE